MFPKENNRTVLNLTSKLSNIIIKLSNIIIIISDQTV